MFSFLDPGVAPTAPVYQPPAKAQAGYDPFVQRPNPLQFAAAHGQVVVKEVILLPFFSLVIIVFL